MIDDNSLTEAAARRIHMALALQTLALGLEPNVLALHEWLRVIPTLEELPNGDDAHLEISLDGDLKRINWSADGDPAGFLPVLGPYFRRMGVAEADIERLEKAGGDLQPERLGCWISLAHNLLDLGYYFPDFLPLERALQLADPHPSVEALLLWADALGIDEVVTVGRSLSGDLQLCEIVLELPGLTLTDQLAAGLSAFTAMSVPALPAGPVEKFADEAEVGLFLHLWLSADGPVRLGLTAPEPTLDLYLGLFAAVGSSEDGTLAAFQGALDVDGPAFLELFQSADGTGITFHYQI